jgi:GNAT superfamily N-acetyltransferase
MRYLTIPLNSSFNKNNFSCGKIVLDEYLHKYANQDIRRKLSTCFILPGIDNRIKVFYTLSNDNIHYEYLPVELKKKMPESYTNLPVTLLGRLAVDQNFKGKGIGELLLLDALKRCYDVSKESIGSMAVVVDPLDEEAVSFYKKYGFIVLPDSGRMFLPMKTIGEIFK